MATTIFSSRAKYIPSSGTGYLPIRPPVTKNKEADKLNMLVQQSKSHLFRCKTAVPFDLFPTTISIDFNKIEVITRNFFMSQQVTTILIESIRFVTVESSVFFATLVIEVKGIEENPMPVRHLHRKDAERIRGIIMGLIACHNKNIDVSSITDEKIVEKIVQIGMSAGDY